MKLMITGAVLAAGISSAAFGQGGPADPFGDATVERAEAQTKAAERFDQLDVNHDGFISADEIAAAQSGGQRAGRMLEGADANADGKVARMNFSRASCAGST